MTTVLLGFYFPCEDNVRTDNPLLSRSGPTSMPAAGRLRLTAEEGDHLFGLITRAQTIRRHEELFAWLRGALHEYLPHEILIRACGDFARRHLTLDIASALPGVRTAQLEFCSIDDLLWNLHSMWLESGRRPIVLRAEDALSSTKRCPCRVHAALSETHALLVHGIHDARDGEDTLFIASLRASFTRGRPKDRFLAIVDLLLPQIEIAYRLVTPYSITENESESRARSARLNLSSRELEILEHLCRGNSNLDIARALEISPLTVKNHVQRIYRKIGVSNRTQAAATYDAVFQDFKRTIAQSGP